MALMRNPNLAISQSNRRIAAYQIVAAEGAYDVKLPQLQPSYTHSVQPPTNLFQTGPNGGAYTVDTLGANAGFSGQTLGGTHYSASASGSRTTSNLVTDSFDPYYPTAFSFNITQPLARGSHMDDPRRRSSSRVSTRIPTLMKPSRPPNRRSPMFRIRTGTWSRLGAMSRFKKKVCAMRSRRRKAISAR